MRNNHPVGDPLKLSREVWVEMFRQSLRNLTLLKPKKKFILLHSLRQDTPFYDPESFRFAYVDIMELNVLENNCQCYKCRLLISQQHLKPDAKLSEIVYPVNNPEHHNLFNDTHPSRPNKGAPHLPFPGENDN